MKQSELFEAIRREDVVVFAGAGFSRYSGYPLGGQLSKTIFDALTAEEQARVVEQWPLEYLSEEVERIKHGSRDFLNNILDNEFAAAPKSTADHDLLASIPHFRTIITTNYDALFENAYGEQATLIVRETDVTKWDDRKVNIVKIHGDLSDKSSIILTRGDYSRFYRKDYASPLWATIIKAISTKNILFLGYGYEDPNVWAIFNNIYDHLGDTRKAAYFVGPGAARDKIGFLKSKNIHYIDHTGESFLKELLDHIKDHIFKDMENKLVTPETFRRFTSTHHLSVGLEDTGEGYKIHSIKAKDGKEMHGTMKFSLDENSDFPERYKAFFDKGQLEELVMEQHELAKFRMDVEGLKLFGEGELSQISIKKTPKIIPFDLIFSSEGFEVRNLTAQIYAGKKSVNIKSKLHTMSFELAIDFSDPSDIRANWSMEHDAIYHNVAEELEVHQFLKYFFSQKHATLYLGKDSKLVKQCPAYDEKRIADADRYLAYFNALKEVERAFDVRFTDFYPIDKESSDDLNWILKVIRGERFVKGSTLELSLAEVSPDIISRLERLKTSEEPMEIFMNSDSAMLLHGQRLPIHGAQTEIPFPEVVNLKAIQSGKTRTIKLKSRSGTIYQRFQLAPFPSLTENL